MGEICVIFLSFYLYIIYIYIYLCSAVAEATKNGVNDLRRLSPRNSNFKDSANINQILKI